MLSNGGEQWRMEQTVQSTQRKTGDSVSPGPRMTPVSPQHL